MGFITIPSDWEVKHAAGIFQGRAYLEEHGSLPNTPIWRMLERRFDRAPERFAFWHPNVSLILREARDLASPIPPPNIPRDCWDPRTQCPPPGGVGCVDPPSTVPEPSGALLGLAAVLAGLVVLIGRRSWIPTTR